MIHNLNTARHLAGREVVAFGYHGYRLAQTFAIPDTELLVLDFAGGATAHLSITWAADLAIYDREGERPRAHQRELRGDRRALARCASRRATAGPMLSATRDGQIRLYPVEAAAAHPLRSLGRGPRGGPAGGDERAGGLSRPRARPPCATAHPTARPVAAVRAGPTVAAAMPRAALEGKVVVVVGGSTRPRPLGRARLPRARAPRWSRSASPAPEPALARTLGRRLRV